MAFQKPKYTSKYRIEAHRWQYCNVSSPASYFITVITADRDHILGRVEDGVMELSPFGKIVKRESESLDPYYKHIYLDEYVTMPDHLHCLITIRDVGQEVAHYSANGQCVLVHEDLTAKSENKAKAHSADSENRSDSVDPVQDKGEISEIPQSDQLPQSNPAPKPKKPIAPCAEKCSSQRSSES